MNTRQKRKAGAMTSWNSKLYRRHLAKTGNFGALGRPLNPMAKALGDGSLKPKAVPNKKRYTRKRSWDYVNSTIKDE